MRLFIFLISIAIAPSLWSAPVPVSTETVKPAVTPELVKRRQEVQAWATKGDPSSAYRLMEALSDKDFYSRALAARGLGDMRWSAARPALEQLLLSDTHTEVREAASQALKTLRDPASVPALLKALNDKQVGVRETVLDALGFVGGSSAVPGVSAALRDPAPGVRRTAAASLQRIGDPSAIPALAAAMKDSDLYVRANAIQAIGTLSRGTPIPALREALKDPEALVRISAARALASSGDLSGADVAKAHVKDPNMSIRQLALETLGWMPSDSEARKILQEAAQDKDAVIRQVAQTALQRHAQKAPHEKR